MTGTSNIREHMEVVGSDGSHVGVVDKVEGHTIKLAKSDQQANGMHHWIPTDWVASVDRTVHLNKSRDDAVRQWQTEAPGVPAAPKM